jgi:hypothetical protein
VSGVAEVEALGLLLGVVGSSKSENGSLAILGDVSSTDKGGVRLVTAAAFGDSNSGCELRCSGGVFNPRRESPGRSFEDGKIANGGCGVISAVLALPKEKSVGFSIGCAKELL